MKTTRIACLLLSLALLLSVLTGCSSQSKPAAEEKKTDSAAEGRAQITLMVDHDFRIDDIGGYLMKKYPQVDFDIVLGRNGVSYLRKAAENGDLPDIMISGSTWGRAGKVLEPYLYDLSATDIASEFYTVYLDNYTTTDGKVYWLPGCAAIEGVMANKALFEANGIALPTDYASFTEACARFTELGIRPYASDYKYDYTCSYLLQSWSVPLLQSAAGKDWRLAFESGETDTLDETIGLRLFEKLDEVLRMTGITPDDATRGYGATFGDFTEGRVAMIRQSTNNASYYEAGMTDLVLLPYFGETETDGWYFTTPSYAVAMSGALKGSANEELCLDIVRTLFTQECMDIFAEEVQAFTAYNKGISFSVQEQFANIVPYVESNHMYTYLAQDNVQSASKVAVQRMIAEGAAPAEALAAFNEAVVAKAEAQPVVATLEKGYSRAWTEHGNEALSAVVDTVAAIAGCDILMAPATMCASAVYAGDYTAEELGNLLYGGGVTLMRRQLTGAEIKRLAETLVAGGGTAYDPITLSTLPAAYGCRLIVARGADGGFTLEALEVDGKPIADDATYSFVYVDNTSANLKAAFGWNRDEHGGNDIVVGENAEDFDWESYDGFSGSAQHLSDLWQAWFAEGGKLSEPSNYIQVK